MCPFFWLDQDFFLCLVSLNVISPHCLTWGLTFISLSAPGGQRGRPRHLQQFALNGNTASVAPSIKQEAQYTPDSDSFIIK